jgi:hypothetical protein
MAQTWRDAVGELLDLQDAHRAWLDGLPDNLTESATAEALRAICEIDLSELGGTAARLRARLTFQAIGRGTRALSRPLVRLGRLKAYPPTTKAERARPAPPARPGTAPERCTRSCPLAERRKPRVPRTVQEHPAAWAARLD